LRSTYDLLMRSYPRGIPAEDYFPLLAVLEPTDISARNLGMVLEAIDGRPYAEHYYALLHELPHRRPAYAEISRVQGRLKDLGFTEWLREDD